MKQEMDRLKRRHAELKRQYVQETEARVCALVGGAGRGDGWEGWRCNGGARRWRWSSSTRTACGRGRSSWTGEPPPV